MAGWCLPGTSSAPRTCLTTCATPACRAPAGRRPGAWHGPPQRRSRLGRGAAAPGGMGAAAAAGQSVKSVLAAAQWVWRCLMLKVLRRHRPTPMAAGGRVPQALLTENLVLSGRAESRRARPLSYIPPGGLPGWDATSIGPVVRGDSRRPPVPPKATASASAAGPGWIVGLRTSPGLPAADPHLGSRYVIGRSAGQTHACRRQVAFVTPLARR